MQIKLYFYKGHIYHECNEDQLCGIYTFKNKSAFCSYCQIEIPAFLLLGIKKREKWPLYDDIIKSDFIIINVPVDL